MSSAFSVGMLNAPGKHLPPVPRLQDFPFNAVCPLFLLLEAFFCHGDLLAIATFRVFRLSHATGRSAATQHQEKKNQKTACSHSPFIGIISSGLKGNVEKMKPPPTHPPSTWKFIDSDF